MDTRSKIIPMEQARENLRGREVRWVRGDFDPLLAEHVRRLRDASQGRPLVVEVTNPARPLLPQQARAELVAALGMVDYVVLGNGGSGAILDSDVTRHFIEHVLGRHEAKGAG